MSLTVLAASIAAVAAVSVAISRLSGPKAEPLEPASIEQRTHGPVGPAVGHTEETSRSIRRVGRSHDVSVAGIGHVRGLDRAGASIHQTTEGACSPAVSETYANVTITLVCPGVDPKALQRLNELLDKKDLALQDKIREAEAGTRKYGALSQHLATEIRHSAPAQEAKALLEEGKLDEAGAILFAEAYNRANHDRANENHAQAVASYQRALQIKPDHFGTYYNLADSYRKMGDHEQALRAFEQALEI